MMASPKYSKVRSLSRADLGKVPEKMLSRWEMMCNKFGLSKQGSHLLLLVFFLMCFLVFYFVLSAIIGSPTAAPKAATIPADLDLAPSTGGEKPDKDLHHKSTMTVISSRRGPDGKMHSHTTTETTGVDKDGHIHATREKREGAGADKEAEKMMASMNSMLSGFGLDGLLGGLFGGGAQDPDPFAQLGMGGFGQVGQRATGDQVLQLRDIQRGGGHPQHALERRRDDQAVMDLNSLISSIFEPQRQPEMMVEIPMMLIGEPMHDHASWHHRHAHRPAHHHEHNHGPSMHGSVPAQASNANGQTPELEVVPQNP
jgi:hypothetical protein